MNQFCLCFALCAQFVRLLWFIHTDWRRNYTDDVHVFSRSASDIKADQIICLAYWLFVFSAAKSFLMLAIKSIYWIFWCCDLETVGRLQFARPHWKRVHSQKMLSDTVFFCWFAILKSVYSPSNSSICWLSTFCPQQNHPKITVNFKIKIEVLHLQTTNKISYRLLIKTVWSWYEHY